MSIYALPQAFDSDITLSLLPHPHSDLKPSNVLVNSNCDLAICDFGLARGVSAEVEGKLTEYVVTRWYRAPELLCETEAYGPAVDVWSVGCIFGELLARRPLFKGSSTPKQLALIIQTLGTPTPDELETVKSRAALRNIQSLPPRRKITLDDWGRIFPGANPLACDLLHRMLQFDPRKRLTVDEALAHPYLAELHARATEPTCDRAFNFDFEKDYPDEMPQDLLQQHMYDVMLEVRSDDTAPAPLGVLAGK